MDVLAGIPSLSAFFSHPWTLSAESGCSTSLTTCNIRSVGD